MISRYHKNHEIAIETLCFDEGLRYQAMIYSTTPTEDEEGERVLLRDKIVDSGPILDTWGEARAWALGRLSTATPTGKEIEIVFSGEAPNLVFVEVESPPGRGIDIGEWTKRDNYSVLRLRAAV